MVPGLQVYVRISKSMFCLSPSFYKNIIYIICATISLRDQVLLIFNMSLVMHRFTIQDLEYLRHGDRSLMLGLIRPAGEGRFPIIVDLHGGAWNEGSLSDCRVRDEVLASAGYATAALDFRQGGDECHSPLQDSHYAIHWLRLYSTQLGFGWNSAAFVPPVQWKTFGGINAKSLCVALFWRVINLLSR